LNNQKNKIFARYESKYFRFRNAVLGGISQY